MLANDNTLQLSQSSFRALIISYRDIHFMTGLLINGQGNRDHEAAIMAAKRRPFSRVIK